MFSYSASILYAPSHIFCSEEEEEDEDEEMDDADGDQMQDEEDNEYGEDDDKEYPSSPLILISFINIYILYCKCCISSCMFCFWVRVWETSFNFDYVSYQDWDAVEEEEEASKPKSLSTSGIFQVYNNQKNI